MVLQSARCRQSPAALVAGNVARLPARAFDFAPREFVSIPCGARLQACRVDSRVDVSLGHAHKENRAQTKAKSSTRGAAARESKRQGPNCGA
jgi:hypothetical protein